jgi:hypothetical protein
MNCRPLPASEDTQPGPTGEHPDLVPSHAIAAGGPQDDAIEQSPEFGSDDFPEGSPAQATGDGAEAIEEGFSYLMPGVTRHCNRLLVDLHGLGLHEADQYISGILAELDPSVRHIRFITGRGRHTPDGLPVLRGFVENRFRKQGHSFVSPASEPGVVDVSWQ